MRAAVIAFTRRGAAMGRVLADDLGAKLHAPARFAEAVGAAACESLEAWTAEQWSGDALVFVGAAGIAVRAIAPHIKDKFTDPAVVSVDELGQFAVPL
ncbi:MAG: cobalamin biosynthesis protein CbiG, partial [Clostridia bacterium]|nr:cobalamin biosynthesis protein CbiG [Clostridia bacterium]